MHGSALMTPVMIHGSLLVAPVMHFFASVSFVYLPSFSPWHYRSPHQ
jgi:hypothetical protein